LVQFNFVNQRTNQERKAKGRSDILAPMPHYIMQFRKRILKKE